MEGRTRRVKRLLVGVTVLEEILKHGTGENRVVDNALPEDARIVDLQFQAWSGELELIFESEAFPPVPGGGAIPTLPPPTYRRVEQQADGREPQVIHLQCACGTSETWQSYEGDPFVLAAAAGWRASIERAGSFTCPVCMVQKRKMWAAARGM